MLKRLGHVIGSGVDMLEARARVLFGEVQHAASAIPLFIGAGALGGVGVLGLFGAAYLGLAPVVGAAWALLIVSGGAVVVAAVTAVVARRIMGGRLGGPEEAKARAAEATERFKETVGMGEDDEEHLEEGVAPDERSLKDRVMETALQNPDAVGAAALALVGIVGPVRSLKLLARGAAAASAVSAVVRGMQGEESEPARAGRRTEGWNGVGRRK